MRLRSFAEIEKTWHENSGLTPQGWEIGTTTLVQLQRDASETSDKLDRLLEFTVWAIVAMIVLSLTSLLFLMAH